MKKPAAPAPRLHSQQAPKEKKIECATCGLPMTVSTWLVKQCVDTNATELKNTLTGMTKFGEKIGDWQITVKNYEN